MGPQVVTSVGAEQPHVSVAPRHPRPTMLAAQSMFDAGNAPTDWRHWTHVSSNPLKASSQRSPPEQLAVPLVQETQSLIFGLPGVSSHCPVVHWEFKVHCVLHAVPVHA